MHTAVVWGGTAARQPPGTFRSRKALIPFSTPGPSYHNPTAGVGITRVLVQRLGGSPKPGWLRRWLRLIVLVGKGCWLLDRRVEDEQFWCDVAVSVVPADKGNHLAAAEPFDRFCEVGLHGFLIEVAHADHGVRGFDLLMSLSARLSTSCMSVTITLSW